MATAPERNAAVLTGRSQIDARKAQAAEEITSTSGVDDLPDVPAEVESERQCAEAAASLYGGPVEEELFVLDYFRAQPASIAMDPT
jgi:hypothetical protein